MYEAQFHVIILSTQQVSIHLIVLLLHSWHNYSLCFCSLPPHCFQCWWCRLIQMRGRFVLRSSEWALLKIIHTRWFDVHCVALKAALKNWCQQHDPFGEEHSYHIYLKKMILPNFIPFSLHLCCFRPKGQQWAWNHWKWNIF